MKKSTKLLVSASAIAGAAMLYWKEDKYYKKYPILKEYRSLTHFAFPPCMVAPKPTKIYNKLSTREVVEMENVVTTTRRIRSYDGEEIFVNLIEPLDVKEGESLPCIVYYHGGGYVTGALKSYFTVMEKYVNLVRCKVVFVHYRTLFEKNADACFEDSYAALQWTYDNAGMLGIRRDKIAVAGDSAGGGITAAITHMIRDRKGPEVCYQILIYPVVDSSMSTKSMKLFTDVPAWNAKTNAKMWDAMKKSLSPDMLEYVSPIMMSDFSGLCNGYVEVEEYDCLHDEGKLYAQRLIENGYQIELNDIKGTFHGFDQRFNKVLSKQIFEKRARVLRKAFE